MKLLSNDNVNRNPVDENRYFESSEKKQKGYGSSKR